MKQSIQPSLDYTRAQAATEQVMPPTPAQRVAIAWKIARTPFKEVDTK